MGLPSSTTPQNEPTPSHPPFTLTTTTLPLPSLPPGSYLVHATNCLGTWGAGIALELARLFPAACAVYTTFCAAAKPAPDAPWPPRSLAGRCLVIPPQDADVAAGAPAVSVVCLFTSYGYGRANGKTGKPGRDGVEAVVRQTGEAAGEFRAWLDGRGGEGVVVYSPRFNSGAFRVPWERTVEMLGKDFAGWEGRWVVLDPPV